MSITEDLRRNRAAFEGLVAGVRAPAAEVLRPVPPLGGTGRAAEPPARSVLPVRRNAAPPEIVPAEEREPRRTVYSLGLPPEPLPRWNPDIETSLVYPETNEEKAAAENDNAAFSDDAYKSLLRRFDTDARQESQLSGEEGLL